MTSPEDRDRTESLQPRTDPQEIAGRHAAQRSSPIPERIGPYRILKLKELGEGGMGIV